MIRAILALMRRDDAEPVHIHDAAAQRAAMRALRLRWLEEADALRAEARAMFRDAMQAETFAARQRLYSLAIAKELRAEGWHARAGGDYEAERVHILDAEEYEARAGDPRPVEAAHA